jgi:transposase InsO family protein
VEDQTENGTRFRILTLIDEFTRECLAMHIAWSIRAVDVITVIEGAIERYGTAGHMRSDNGPEFIAYAIQGWLKGNQIRAIYIEPGAPWENGHIESFHDKLRDECCHFAAENHPLICGSKSPTPEAQVSYQDWFKLQAGDELCSTFGAVWRIGQCRSAT